MRCDFRNPNAAAWACCITFASTPAEGLGLGLSRRFAINTATAGQVPLKHGLRLWALHAQRDGDPALLEHGDPVVWLRPFVEADGFRVRGRRAAHQPANAGPDQRAEAL